MHPTANVNKCQISPNKKPNWLDNRWLAAKRFRNNCEAAHETHKDTDNFLKSRIR
jgi:hypothetical protein